MKTVQWKRRTERWNSPEKVRESEGKKQSIPDEKQEKRKRTNDPETGSKEELESNSKLRV